MLDYILCMTVTKGVDKSNYAFLTSSNIKAISDYIEAPMTATTFGEGAGTSTPNRKNSHFRINILLDDRV